MLYFQHDIGASMDEKVMQLRLLCGGAAVDAYWYLVERLYKEEKPLVLLENPAETQLVSYWLNLGSDRLCEYVNKMVEIGLFTNKNGLWSKRVEETLGFYKSRAQVSRENGKKGGRPRKKNQKLSQQKPTGFFQETQDKPSEKLSKRKSKSNLGFDKQNLNTFQDSPAEHGGESEKSGEVPRCPHCNCVVYFKPKDGGYDCMSHGIIPHSEVIFGD